MTIRIVTDSACDLPPETIEEHHIDVVPLSIRFGETEYVDRRDLTPTEFWA
jgi:fatty acid-binding protein DegV